MRAWRCSARTARRSPRWCRCSSAIPRTGCSRRAWRFRAGACRACSRPPSWAPADAPALGRLLYVAHLALLLSWLLDKSPEQRATQAWLALLDIGLPLLTMALALPMATALLRTADGLLREGLFGE